MGGSQRRTCRVRHDHRGTRIGRPYAGGRRRPHGNNAVCRCTTRKQFDAWQTAFRAYLDAICKGFGKTRENLVCLKHAVALRTVFGPASTAFALGHRPDARTGTAALCLTHHEYADSHSDLRRTRASSHALVALPLFLERVGCVLPKFQSERPASPRVFFSCIDNPAGGGQGPNNETTG